jgi:hypothetical protein
MIIKELEYLFHKIPDYQITPFLSIKHPTYKEILEYGEKKYIDLLCRLCLMPDDYKSELFDMGYNWYEIDEIIWFYTVFIQPNEDLSIIFSSDIRYYSLYENKITGETVLYNSMLGEFLTKNNIKIIREHLNSMIGWIYKPHKEIPSNDRTRDIIIEDDRQRKLTLKEMSGKAVTIKDMITNLLWNKFYDENIKTIREKCALDINKNDNMYIAVDNAFMLGEGSVIEKIAEEIYKELKEK